MKVILYMATTLNGYIAKENNETPWSEEEWVSYSNIIKSTKNIIIGYNTYEIMKKNNEFEKIGNPLTIVITSKIIKSDTNTIFFNSPKQALEVLKNKGFKQTIIAGGSKLNASFLKENLIDEIYIDLEPFIFSNGITLLEKTDFEIKLKLIETKLLSKNTIQLHYLVIKN